MATEGEDETFSIETDRYTCITIDTTKVSFSSDEDFEKKLLASLKRWRQSGVRAVWIKVALEHSSLIAVGAKQDFVYHHAKGRYAMLILWLAENETNNIPGYAHHYVGCGGFVVNEKNQVLVIQEKYGHSQKPHWKLPGGHTDIGEDLSTASEREVFEETGVRAEFLAVISFRHQHNYQFGSSDFYFVCLMRPLSSEINSCQQEIAKCQWMDLEEYIVHPSTSDANRHFAKCYMDNKISGHDTWIVPDRVWSFRKTIKQNVYSIQPRPGLTQAAAAAAAADNAADNAAENADSHS